MNVCTNFHGNASNSFWDISLKTTNVEEKSGDHQSQEETLSGNHECLYKMLCQPIR